jgi:hypothetical protein
MKTCPLESGHGSLEGRSTRPSDTKEGNQKGKSRRGAFLITPRQIRQPNQKENFECFVSLRAV